MLYKQFENYLSAKGISNKSLKNYKSDFNHFTAWIILKIRSFGSYIDGLTEATPFLSRALAEEYKSFMSENTTPVKTINRRLSTLRHLAKFLISAELTDFDFMHGIQNITTKAKKTFSTGNLVDNFINHLEHQKVSKNTIKNYASDVRQFLTWLEEKSYHANETNAQPT